MFRLYLSDIFITDDQIDLGQVLELDFCFHYLCLPGPSERNSYWGGLKREASEASKDGGPGACPRENFSRQRPLDRWKTHYFWRMCY